MHTIPDDYVEKVYAGLLGKIIGVRHGSNIEGWSYENILKIYGEINRYLFSFKNFAADDDNNGTLFFIRALDGRIPSELTPQDIGLAWLNYIPCEHSFLWWGGYGKSTEHTAYLNLKSGIPAPRSGSAAQNGTAVAEQIGGQIFIDAWGLVCPADYRLAAAYAEKAASVSHDGNGIYGGKFIAACVSAAFAEKDIEKIIGAALSVIPDDCEYSRMAHDVIACHRSHPDDWRQCFQFVRAGYGYDRYPGNCHIIPNSAVVLLALLYCGGDFSRAINICAMCGWDTDCNVGNVGTIMGVRNGLAGIGMNWREPIRDFVACSSVIGSLNILDIPDYALYLAGFGYRIAGVQPSGKWKDLLGGKTPKFHFEFPGSTHTFRIASDIRRPVNYVLEQTSGVAHTGTGSLKIAAHPVCSGDEVKVYHKTYYHPDDFSDSRYDPAFSPVLYPGQTIKASVMLDPACSFGVMGYLYVKEENRNARFRSEKTRLVPGKWVELEYAVPPLEAACLGEAGVGFSVLDCDDATLLAYVDDFDQSGSPCYTLDFSKEHMEVWNGGHREVSQFTIHKGIWELEDGELSGSCCDCGEAYTGGFDWEDYTFEATMIPRLGGYHNVNFRVQGAIRSYALGLAPEGRLVLYKNQNGYVILREIAYGWEAGKPYTFRIVAKGNKIEIFEGAAALMEYVDQDRPYLKGQIGASVFGGSHCHYRLFRIGRA